MKKNNIYKKIINLYPIIFPKLYVWLRLIILPIDKIENIIPKNGKILDVGCGYGFSSIYFALTSTKRIVKGIEISPQRINIASTASKHINNLSFEVDDLANQQQSLYNSIVLIDLLHHLNTFEKTKLLSDCHNLLSKNGVLIIKDINTKPLFKYIWNYIHDLVMTRFSKLEFYDQNKMINILSYCGFKVITHYSIKNIFYPHYIYVCKK